MIDLCRELLKPKFGRLYAGLTHLIVQEPITQDFRSLYI
jgi:hypothetical protein